MTDTSPTPADQLRAAASRAPSPELARLLEMLADASDHHPTGEGGVVATVVHPALAVARQLLDGAPAPAVWAGGDPLMEAIAAAVYEQCGTDPVSSVVVDDPRNIAAVAAAVARQLLGTSAAEGAEETHVVTDDSDDPEHTDDCPGCGPAPAASADQLRDRLRAAAQRVLESLDNLIADHQDPGAEALGARYELARELSNTSPEVARQLLNVVEGAVAEPSVDRRARYEDALWVHALNVAAAATAVMAVADAEQASLRAEAEGLDEALRGAISASEKDGARLRADLEEFRAIALSRCRTLDEHDAAPPAPADRAATGMRGLLEHVGINLTGRDITVAGKVVDRAPLRDRIRRAVCEAEGFAWDTDMLEPDEYGEVADAVLAVLADDAAAGVQPPTSEARPDDIQVWPLTRVLTEVRCGSQDWTWDEEWADLDQRHAETGYLDRLEQQIRANGITMPVLIGSDGRLWDGHHRLRIAARLGIAYVPVEITPAAPAAPEEPQ